MFIYNIKKKKRNYKFIIPLVSIVIIVLLLTIIGLITKKNINLFIEHNNLNKVYKKLFFEKNYLELIRNMDIELKKDPFNRECLIYRGYSYFLLGEDEKDNDKMKNFYTLSLFDLRKAIAIGIANKNIDDIYFCIAKIYYYFGEPYLYLSLNYFKKSLSYGNKRKDLFYTLGLVYTNLGLYKEATKTFLDALNYDESEILLLAIANSYYNDKDFINAKKYIERVINISSELKIREKSYLLLGEILFNENNYIEAKNNFDKVIEINDNNSNAYYYLGEINYYQNNIIKARADWRKSLEINPSNIKALKRLYSN